MTTILIAAAVLIALIVVVSVVRSLFERLTIFEYERGLRCDKGRYTQTVGPGRYWLVRNRSTIASERPRQHEASVSSFARSSSRT